MAHGRSLTAPDPHLGSAACAALDLRLRATARDSGSTAVHLVECPPARRQQARQQQARPVTVLLHVTSAAYMEVIPGWAARVRAANASCAVGGSAAHADSTVCVHAKRAGCNCLNASGSGGGGAVSSRAAALHERFLLVRQLLAQRSQGVLAHDPDFFLRPGTVPRLLRELSSSTAGDPGGRLSRGHELVVSTVEGGRRREADEPSWSLAWHSGSPASAQLVDCLVAATTHRQPSSGGRALTMSRPSQVFAAIAASRPQGVAPLHACVLPGLLQRSTTSRLGGHMSTRQRLACARAEGVHGQRILHNRAPASGGRASAANVRALIYHVPTNASVRAQQLALSAALVLANSTGRLLSPPRVSFSTSGRPVSFCELFDPTSVLPSVRLAASLSRSVARSACSSPTPPSAVYHSTLRLVCADFATLGRAAAAAAEAATAAGKPAQLVYACAEPAMPSTKVPRVCTEKFGRRQHQPTPAGGSAPSRSGTS